MENFDFIADYKTPAGWDMHKAFKVYGTNSLFEAAVGVLHALEKEGVQATALFYVPGDRSREELERMAEQGPIVPGSMPFYVDRQALLGADHREG